jgi:hypothetical protein
VLQVARSADRHGGLHTVHFQEQAEPAGDRRGFVAGADGQEAEAVVGDAPERVGVAGGSRQRGGDLDERRAALGRVEAPDGAFDVERTINVGEPP